MSATSLLPATRGRLEGDHVVVADELSLRPQHRGEVGLDDARLPGLGVDDMQPAGDGAVTA
jgi:hypothetical protein